MYPNWVDGFFRWGGGVKLAEFLSQGVLAPFVSMPFYERFTDSMIFYMRDEPSYAIPVGRDISIFLSRSDNTFVGFEINGVSQ